MVFGLKPEKNLIDLLFKLYMMMFNILGFAYTNNNINTSNLKPVLIVKMV